MQRLILLILAPALLPPAILTAQSPNGSSSEPAARPAILGTLDKGKYSNTMIGFELQLDPACTLADEDTALSWSTKFSQRLNQGLRCGDNAILLESFPLHADEKLDLKGTRKCRLKGRCMAADLNGAAICRAIPSARPKLWCRNSLGWINRARNFLVSIMHSWLADDTSQCSRLARRRMKQLSGRPPTS